MKEFIKKLNESKRELKKFSEDKVEFVRKCYDDVVKDIIECESDGGENGMYNHSSEIIRDYKCECYEDDLMSEEEFDRIYELIDFISIESAMSVC